MGVEVLHGVRGELGVTQRVLHGEPRPCPVFGGGGDVVSIAAHAEADELAQDDRAPALGVLELLEQQRAAAVRSHEAVTIAVPGPRRTGRVVVALRERPGLRETADAEPGGRHLATPGQHHLGVSVLDGAVGKTDRVGRCGAGGDHAEVRSLEAVADGQMPRDHVDDRGRDEERRDLAGAADLQIGLALGLDGREATDTGTRYDAAALRIEGAEVDAGVRDRLDARGHAVVDELVHPAGFLRRDVVADGETLHRPADAGGEGRGVEAADEPDAALTAQDGLPGRLDGAADGGNDAEAGDDDSPLAHAVSGRAIGRLKGRGRHLAGPVPIQRTPQALRRALT